jgi:hypothetical protein
VGGKVLSFSLGLNATALIALPKGDNFVALPSDATINRNGESATIDRAAKISQALRRSATVHAQKRISKKKDRGFYT